MRIRLLPDSPLGWTPYAWLIYLSLYIVAAAVTSRTTADWAMNGAGLAVFLGCTSAASGCRAMPCCVLRSGLSPSA